MEEGLTLARQTHRLLHYVCPEAASELGHLAVTTEFFHGRSPFDTPGGPSPE